MIFKLGKESIFYKAKVATFKFADQIVGVLIHSNLNDVLLNEVQAIILERLKENKKIDLFV